MTVHSPVGKTFEQTDVECAGTVRCVYHLETIKFAVDGVVPISRGEITTVIVQRTLSGLKSDEYLLVEVVAVIGSA